MPSNNPLPPKEKALFNRIVKCYEHKQYKNGLKFAKQILSNPKFSNHGETLAMKGLVVNCMEKKEEAHVLVKKGLTNDLKSHVCWHVYGLLYRSEKNYDKAITCYKSALKNDPENLHILRDLSMLQIHVRDMEGYKQTKFKLLQLKPAQRAPWIGYAISNHLLDDCENAYSVLEEFRKTQNSEDQKYEYNELLLYQCAILMQSGKYKQALEHLQNNKDFIMDDLSLQENLGELYIQLGELEKAEEVYTGLIDRNTENVKYYKKLEQIFQPSNQEEKLEIYDFIQKRYPRADAPRILPLHFLTGGLLKERLDAYLRRQIKRGVPPLLITIKQLYQCKDKVKVISNLAQGYVDSLRNCNKFNIKDTDTQVPTTFLYALSFYGQHLDKIGEHEKALEILDEAIQHTPTLIELHVSKARVLKHVGNIQGAVESMDEAQSLDTADRFINCKCARYMMRNNQLEKAATTASKFTRENTSVDNYAREMQCMWYEIEKCSSFYNQGKLGEALKMCHQIEKHFNEITQDQLEFHQYCIRKTTLSAYTKLLKLEDQLRCHEFYAQAADIAIKIYLQLHDSPYKASNGMTIEEEQKLTPQELKKLKNKRRKQQKKMEEKKKQENNKIKQNQGNNNSNNKKDDADKNEDVFCAETLLKAEKPLEEAKKFLAPLKTFRSEDFQTNYLAFMIAERNSKLLQMLQSLLKCCKTVRKQDEHLLQLCKVIFAQKVHQMHSSNHSNVSQVVYDVINRHKESLFSSTDNFSKIAVDLSDKLSAESSLSLPFRLAAAQSMYYLKNKNQAVDHLVNFDENSEGITLKLCKEILRAINNKMFGEFPVGKKEVFVKKCAGIFKHANLFGHEHLVKTESALDNAQDVKINGK